MRSLSLLVAYILTPWMALKMMAKQRHSHAPQGTLSGVAIHLALRELSLQASAALQCLERTSHFPHIAPCSDMQAKL